MLSLAEQTVATRRHTFPAAGVTTARLDTGAGELTIRGRAGASEIEVVADYKAHSPGRLSAQEIIDKLKLSMEVRGGTFYLKTADREDWNWGHDGSIDLTVTVPAAVALEVRDGAGGMTITGIDGDVTIHDGSGGIEVEDVRGKLRIDDGSGSIVVRNVGGAIDIVDGSGSIEIVHAGGDVRIEDGSGSIDVRDVAGRLDVPRKGSGSVHYSDVRGRVDVPRRKHSD